MKTFYLLLIMLLAMIFHSMSASIVYDSDTSFKPIIIEVADNIELTDSSSIEDGDKDIAADFTRALVQLPPLKQVFIDETEFQVKLCFFTAFIRGPPTL